METFNLLDEEKAISLIEAGLDRLIVSVDGATPATHAENRTGADLDQIKFNVKQLQRLRRSMRRETPEIGIEFVLMQRNLGEVLKLLRLAFDMGAVFIILTNVLSSATVSGRETS
jgi:MoaA/NifB/PqqE/SkfB family radical SAM enzyme